MLTTLSAPSTSPERMLHIIRAEFAEMPGMRLTRAQFRRLWNLSEAECDRLLRHLIGAGYLVERANVVGRPIDH